MTLCIHRSQTGSSSCWWEVIPKESNGHGEQELRSDPEHPGHEQEATEHARGDSHKEHAPPEGL